MTKMTRAEYNQHPITVRCRELAKLSTAQLRDKVRGTSRVDLGALRDVTKADCISHLVTDQFGLRAVREYDATRP